MAKQTARRVGAVLAGVACALIPWVTMGLATWLVFTVAAAVLRSRLVIVAAAGYTAATIGWVTAVSVASLQGVLAVPLFLVILVVGGVHALVLSVVLGRRLWHGRPATPAPPAVTDLLTRVAAGERAALADDRALRAAVSRQERRRLSREIAATDPALADELGIGQPGLGEFDDGGLVDVNRASAATLAALPGFTTVMAQRVVAARERYGALTSSAELVVYAELPSEIVEELRDRLLFRKPAVTDGNPGAP